MSRRRSSRARRAAASVVRAAAMVRRFDSERRNWPSASAPGCCSFQSSPSAGPAKGGQVEGRETHVVALMNRVPQRGHYESGETRAQESKKGRVVNDAG